MRENELYDAISGISRDYLSESENYEAIAADFRKEKTLKKRIMIVSTFCVVFVCVAIIGVTKNGLLKRDFQSEDKNNSLISSAELQTDGSESATDSSMVATGPSGVTDGSLVTPDPSVAPDGSLITGETSTATDGSQMNAEQSAENEITGTTKLYYSKLVSNTEPSTLDGYDNSGIASLDIIGFDESMLKDSAGIIEGEILDVWVNHYEYTTAFDKFEPNGQLYHNPSTVAYKIRVNKVLSGDFSVGDVITVEDYFFIFDSIISIKKGGTYVIPIGVGEGILFEHDEIISGSNILESSYYTLYQFHPQIEKVNGGYVVPSDWNTLITDECTEIIMDIEDGDYPFPDSLYYVPEHVFYDSMSLILQNSGNESYSSK